MSLAALGVVLLVAAVAASVVVIAVRAGIAARRDSVMVLHMLGAEDRDIAWHFARRTSWLALLGAVLGVALAIALLWALMPLAAPILLEISWQDLPWSGLTAIPISAALIAWAATILSILLWLRRLP